MEQATCLLEEKTVSFALCHHGTNNIAPVHKTATKFHPYLERVYAVILGVTIWIIRIKSIPSDSISDRRAEKSDSSVWYLLGIVSKQFVYQNVLNYVLSVPSEYLGSFVNLG